MYKMASSNQGQAKAAEKKIRNFEKNLTGYQQQMMTKKSRGAILSAIISIVMIRQMYAYFKGEVIATLPFEPLSMFSGLTHYGIEGDDMRQCSMSFIYVLSNLTIGNYVKKLMGFEGERVTLPQTGGNPWGWEGL